jgi:hypothetical protein
MNNALSNPPSKPSPSKPKVFVPLSMVVLLCLVCLVGAAVLAWWSYQSRFTSTARLERERAVLSNQVHRAQVERQRGEEESRLALARTRQAEALAGVHATARLLDQLLAETSAVAADAAGLRTNKTGQLAALHPDLLALARRFYETDLRTLPASADVVQKIEGVRRVEQQLASAQGTAYEPDARLRSDMDTVTAWAQEGLQKTGLLRTQLSTITQESKIKMTTNQIAPGSPTLEVARQQSEQAEAAARQQIIAQRTGDAKTNAALTVAQAEAQRILESAKLETARIQQEVETARAELERQRTMKKADQKLKDAQATVTAERKLDEASRIKLRQKAADPQIQATLAPFITPGYMDAYGRTMAEKKSHAFSVLKVGGALEPTMEGLQKIADLAYSRLDKVRPRWTFHKYNSRGWRYHPQEMEMVKEAQALLNELGPVLVEMGLLEP